MDNYFVYLNDARHIWRFVYFARRVASGEEAIRKAWAEASLMGNEPVGGYMAVPAGSVTTLEAETPAEFYDRP